MSALPRLARNFTSMTTATLVARFANALLTVAAARQLGVENYGLYAIALTILFFAQVLTTFGTSRVIIRDVAQDKSLANRYLSSTALITLTLALVSLILLPLLSPIFGYGLELRTLTLVIGVGVAGHALARPAEAILRAFERMVLLSSLRFIVMTATTGIGLWLIFSGFGVLELIWLQVIAVWFEAFFLLLALHIRVNRLKWQPSKEMVLRIIQLGSPLFAMTIIALVQGRSDILLLGRVSGSESVGLYSPAVSVIRYVSIVQFSVIGAVFPYLSTRWQDSAQSFKASYLSTLRLLLIYGIGITVAIMFMADAIVELIFGAEYAASADVLRILAWAMVFNLIVAPISAAIVIERSRLVRFLPFAAIIATLNVSLNLLLIPVIDFMGSAWAALVTAVVAFLIYYWWIGRVRGLERPPLVRLLWRPALAGLGATLVFLLLGRVNIWIAALPAAAVYGLILLVLGSFRPREIDYVRQVVNRRIRFWKNS